MATTRAEASPRPWILDPWRDLALFVLSPLWILAIVLWARARFGLQAFGPALLALGAVGHHLPGFIRAYTDPVLFARFRARFLGAPLFFGAVVAAFFLLGLHGLQVILLLWGAWHGAMQVNGFLRIYDAKAGRASATASRLDQAMCLAWFGAGLLYSDSRMLALLTCFYGAGGALVDAEGLFAFRAAWAALTAVLTAIFLVRTWRDRRAGEGPSPVKIPLMISSFAFWWYAMVAVDNALLGLLLFEIFHDVQYNALVWVYNRNRVARGMTASRAERFLFRPGVLPVLAYAVLFLGYGALGVAGGYTGTHVPAASALQSPGFWTGLFLVSTFLHFYFDGFIWRVREAGTRAGLGLEGGTTGAPSRFRGAWKWAFFVVPAAALAAAELTGDPAPLPERYRSMARVLPESWTAYYLLAEAEEGAGREAEAAAAYARVLALDPDFKPAHLRLAVLSERAGREAEAVRHYERAVTLDPGDDAARRGLVNLLLAQGRAPEAAPHLAFLSARAPGDAGLAYMAGAAFMHARRHAEAVPFLRRTLALDPAQPKAWSYLGIAAGALGDTASAEDYYQRALELDPRFARRAEAP